MSGAQQVALMFGPLAIYFLTLGIWQGSRGPRVVPGPIDSCLLALAASGIIAFGPVGRALSGSLPRTIAIPSLGIILGLGTLWMIGRARCRASIYNVDPETLQRTLQEVIEELPGQYQRTMTGYEDGRQGKGVTIATTAGQRTGEVEAYGRQAEAMIDEVIARLRRRLPSHNPSRAGRVGWMWLLLSCLTILIPLMTRLLNDSGAFTHILKGR